MDAGKLRHLITIEHYEESQDESGEDIRDYSTFGIVRGSIRTLRGRELFAAQQVFAAADVEIRIRFLPGVTENMRALHDGVYYNILNVDNVERRDREMVLLCETGLSATK